VLDISNNAIAHLTNLKHLARLEEVWASSNGLASFDELEHELADKPALTTVYLEGNPLQLQNAVLYRNKVRLALPQVKQIDASGFLFYFIFLIPASRQGHLFRLTANPFLFQAFVHA
jgi:protein phosphatase 1 regulatory subunit 7